MALVAPITVSVEVPCSVLQAWDAFTNVNAITAWNFAAPEWHCPHATNDLVPGGRFCYRMEARDGTMGFDFEGTYLDVVPHSRIRYALGPDREVLVEFISKGSTTEVIQSFTPESEYPLESQRAGWQSIMNNYQRYLVSATPS